MMMTRVAGIGRGQPGSTLASGRMPVINPSSARIATPPATATDTCAERLRTVAQSPVGTCSGTEALLNRTPDVVRGARVKKLYHDPRTSACVLHRMAFMKLPNPLKWSLAIAGLLLGVVYGTIFW